MYLVRAITFLFSYLISIGLLIGTYRLKEKWKQVLNISLVMLILPSVSQSYCLLYLFPAMVLFLRETGHKPLSLFTSYGMILVSFLFVCIIYECPILEIFGYESAIVLLLAAVCVYTWKCNIKIS